MNFGRKSADVLASRSIHGYQISNYRLKSGRSMTRPSDYTRERILKAALNLFADRGYEGASVRAIVSKAKVNQAAINYHFAGKEGLYRAVLQTAFEALTKDARLDADALESLPREEALRRFVRRQLQPLAARDDLARYLQVFNWEALRPTPVFKSFVAEEAAPFMAQAGELIRRFLPKANARTVMVAAIWLLGQCSVFVRNREQLAGLGVPTRGGADNDLIDELAGHVSRWAVAGLGQGAQVMASGHAQTVDSPD
jgi:AcrR family transcriptional regulator